MTLSVTDEFVPWKKLSESEMLETIYAIGQQISAGRDAWADVIEPPKADDKEGKLRLYRIGVTFDLDDHSVRIDPGSLGEFTRDFEELKRLGSLKVKGGNNKALYPCVDAGKVEQLAKTLFGKEGAQKGEMLEKIEGVYPFLKESELGKVLLEIKSLTTAFEELFPLDQKGKYSIQKVVDQLGLEKASKLVMIHAEVVWTKEGIEQKPLAQLGGFEELVEKEFLKVADDSGVKHSADSDRLCYVSGVMREDVMVAEFGDRYNINKVFVQTTQNYATGFDKKLYNKNYQASNEIQTYLDRGSQHILTHFKTKIADWPHAVIPQVLSNETGKVNLHLLESLKAKSDLLFQLQTLDGMVSTLENDEMAQAVWLNFVGIESDGNYFKINNYIKDVPHLHFLDVIKAMKAANKRFKPWLGDRYSFNLGMMYGSIPCRKDQKQNPALQLFGSVLEQRKIDIRTLMQHFTDLILCHRYERYKAYANIYDPKKDDNFDYAAKDAVFRYLAFIYALRHLNQLNNAKQMTPAKNVSQHIKEDLETFFDEMDYSTPQKALFYLGRAMNRVAFAQKDKGNRKRVLEKVNYNGMDEKSLLRLHNDLFEKAKQYDVVDKLTWDLSEFNSRFQIETWSMNPQEALFYLLTGYTYRIRTQLENPDQEPSNKE